MNVKDAEKIKAGTVLLYTLTGQDFIVDNVMRKRGYVCLDGRLISKDGTEHSVYVHNISVENK
jgi:hypothetical protein